MAARPASHRRPASATTADADPAREAWALIVQFFKAAKLQFLAELGMTAAQAQMLLHLDPAAPVPMSELASLLGCDASNVTGLVDRLEFQGLLERRSAVQDRRVKMIAVTTAGARVRRKLLDRWYAAPPPINALPLADKKALLALLKKAANTTPAK